MIRRPAARPRTRRPGDRLIRAAGVVAATVAAIQSAAAIVASIRR